jgi:tRNA(Ile2) C34 agmatinyltransferase TiaS
MEENILCPRCGSSCDGKGSVFACHKCGFAFGRYETSSLSKSIFSGTIKTESTVTQKIERPVGTGGEGKPIVLRIGGNQSGD